MYSTPAEVATAASALAARARREPDADYAREMEDLFSQAEALGSEQLAWHLEAINHTLGL